MNSSQSHSRWFAWLRSHLAALPLTLWLGTGSAGWAAVTASTGHLEIPTYPWAAVEHPYFRGTDGKNIYPYPMLDFLSRDKTNRTYRTVVLENEYLRITFLPELGGKIQEVIDKTTGQPMFYVNHVVKPGLIGQCGAWTSGGVEWNTGPQGHTVSCMQPVDVVILPAGKDGSRSVAIGETERIYGTKWTVVVTLRPGRAFIEERIRIYNPTETIRPYYFWNCTASPNTPGFRFIYPMTLGMDHSGETFFNWPIDHGKDLTRGTNYQDASSIFAYNCDQDFFGSYNDDLDHGVVSYANHHQLPGKKAWTWGQGSFGKMHQMDLTDDDGPYNEVQTGPLLTQGEVGRLDPCEAVEWQEWWYPVHGIGGFTFANRDVAVNAARHGDKLELRMLGTGAWRPVQVRLRDGKGTVLVRANCHLSPRQSTDVTLSLPSTNQAVEVELVSGNHSLAQFSVPLNLPQRTPPEPKAKPETAAELAQAGWEDYLFARGTEAAAKFQQALAKDPKWVEAHTGLAFLQLTSDPSSARREASEALTADSDCGLAQFALAVSSFGEDDSAALDHAWKAALDPVTAIAGRALAAEILLRDRQWDQAVAALSQPGPWQTDPLCRNRLALAHWMRGEANEAARLARANFEVDPLDSFALSVLWLTKAPHAAQRLETQINGNAQSMLDVLAAFVELQQYDIALRLLREFYLNRVRPEARDPMPGYYAGFLAHQLHEAEPARTAWKEARTLPANGVFPHRAASLPVLREAVANDPRDGHAAIYLGHLLFHLGRYREGCAMWKKAAALGADPVIADRALGLAAKTLEGNLKSARGWLEKGSQADPSDSIVARDLADVLLALADKTDSDAEKRALATEARDRLEAAFAKGKGRSDFVALLARAENRLGQYAEMARMLDSVRITIWEGAHEAHDLFVEAHLALGKAQLEAGQPAAALDEFNRALEYPKNLATGKLENAPEAPIQYLRGLALEGLGRKSEALAAWKKAANEPASRDEKTEAARSQAREALERAEQHQQ